MKTRLAKRQWIYAWRPTFTQTFETYAIADLWNDSEGRQCLCNQQLLALRSSMRWAVRFLFLRRIAQHALMKIQYWWKTESQPFIVSFRLWDRGWQRTAEPRVKPRIANGSAISEIVPGKAFRNQDSCKICFFGTFLSHGFDRQRLHS